MNRNKLIVLAAIAALLVLAASWQMRPREDGASIAGGRLFPGLEARINDVSRLTVQLNPEQTLTLSRDSDGWVVSEKENYPANLGQVRKVLLALARTEKVEQKTANPDYYERLGVQDIEQADEGLTRVLRLHAGGESLAEVIVGKTGDGGNSYLRPLNQPQSWLGSEWIDVPARVSAWLDAPLLDVGAERLSAVEVLHPDGAGLRIERDAEGISLSSEGAALASKTEEVDRVLGVLGELGIEDVIDEPEVADEDWRYSRFITGDGLNIAVQSVKRDDRLYARFSAEIESSEPEEELLAEAQRLNQRFAGRTYLLASHLDARIAPALADLQDSEAAAATAQSGEQ